jgi:hypothetical protein
MPGFEFDSRAKRPHLPGADLFSPDPADPGPLDPGPLDPDPAGSRPRGVRPTRPNDPGPPRSDLRTAGAEWVSLLRSLLPQPAKRSWSTEFRAGLQFRGWGMKVALPILAMIVFGVVVVVITGANNGNSGTAPPATSLGFPPATLAGQEFVAADSGRGISQTLGQVASDGPEIVAVGSQSGARIPRAQFFVSLNDGRSWTMGSERTPSGGEPSPGHPARFVAGGPGEWVAVGPGSIWTSTNGRVWTLSPSAGMPLLPGDQISVLKRTASGFIAAGANVPGGDQAKSSPVIFLSANGISWRRLDARQLRLPAGSGRVLNIRYAATAGKLTLIAGDVATTTKSKRTLTSGAWLSSDSGDSGDSGDVGGGSGSGSGDSWVPAVSPDLTPPGHGAQPQITGLAPVGDGFVLVRPATVSKKPAVDVYRSGTGTAWTFETTLSTPAGLITGMVSGGPDGAVVTGQAGRTLTAFVSADGVSWQQTGAFGRAASESVSGVAVTQSGAVVTGTTAPPAARKPALAVVAGRAPTNQVDVAKIPDAFEPQVAVNGVAAAGGAQVAVGSANGYPAAWASADGGTSWTRATGATPAVLGRPGMQQLTSVTVGSAGWLAVGGVVAGAAQHPVVVSSADGSSWRAADGEGAFGAPGLFTEQAAAGHGGYVIVGYQDIQEPANGTVVTIAAAWWSAGLTGFQRAGDAAAGALDGPGASRQMLTVTAGQKGFFAVGSDGAQPAAWISPDGRTWRQASLPVPMGAKASVLQHVASSGQSVVAVGTAVTTTGQHLPFAASSSDGGATWTESALPVPAGMASVTALAAAGGGFTAAGTFGATPGHQDVVVWTSANGTNWKAVTPAGEGMTGLGIQAITGLTAAGSTLTGVGFTASPAEEEPVFWQSPIR